MSKIPTAWSWSAFEMWRQCPLKYKLTKIDKLDKEQSAAMIRGNRVHIALASYIEGKAALPAEVTSPYHQQLYAAMREFSGLKIVEKQMGFDASWHETGWVAPDVWLRSIYDVALIYDDKEVELVDHKTGKRYGSNDEQVELFATTAMSRFPDAPRIVTRLIYIDGGAEEFATHPTKDREKLQAKWAAAAAPMLGDRQWPARPNDKCGWCVFNKAKGGQCRFG